MLLRSSAKRVKRDRKCKVAWTPPAESANRSTRTSSKRSSIDTDLSGAPFYKNDIKERKRLRWESTPTAKRTGNGPITKVPPDILGLIFSLVDIRSTILLPSVCKLWRQVYIGRLQPRLDAQFSTLFVPSPVSTKTFLVHLSGRLCIPSTHG